MTSHQHDRRPSYRGLRLDGPVAEFHRAVGRLRWDTVPAGAGSPTPQPTSPALVAARTQVTDRPGCLRRHREHQPAPDRRHPAARPRLRRRQRPVRRDPMGLPAPSAAARRGRAVGHPQAMRQLAALATQAADPGRGGGRLARPPNAARGRRLKGARWHERAAGRRPRATRPAAFPSTRSTGPAPSRAGPAWPAPARAALLVIGRPSIPWSATASTTPASTRPSSSAGGSGGPRPTSAWPPGSCSTPWTSTAPPAWPPSASCRKRRTCGSRVRWWPRGAVAGTTGSPRPGSATAHPAASPTSTGAARWLCARPTQPPRLRAAATAGCAASTRRRCPRSRPPSAPCSTPTRQPRPGQPARSADSAGRRRPPVRPPGPGRRAGRPRPGHPRPPQPHPQPDRLQGLPLRRQRRPGRQEVTAAFTTTALAIGLDPAEVGRTLASARTAGLANPRTIPAPPGPSAQEAGS